MGEDGASRADARAASDTVQFGAALTPAARELYAQLIEQVFEGTALSQDEKLVFVSERLRNLLGYAAEEIVGRPLAGFIASDSRALVLQRHAERLAGGNPAPNYEVKLLCKDGRMPSVELNTRIEHQGRPAVLTVMRDLSERRRAEQRFRLLLHEAADLVFLLDQNGHILEVNREVTSALGCAAAELVGQPFLSIVRDEQGAPADCGLTTYLTRSLRGVYGQLGRKDGSVLEVEVKTASARIDGQRAVLCIARDLTPQRRTARLVERANERLAQVNEANRLILAPETGAEQLLGLVLARAVRGTGFRAGGVYRVDRRSGALRDVCLPGPDGFGQMGGEPLLVLPHGAAVAQRVIEGRRTVRLDATSDPLLTPEDRELLAAHGVKVLVGVALMAPPRSFGAFLLGPTDRSAVDDEDVRFLDELGTQLALGLRYKAQIEELEASQSDLLDHKRRLSEMVWERTQELDQKIAQLEASTTSLKQRTKELSKLNQELASFNYHVGHDLKEPLRAIEARAALLLRDLASVLDDRTRRHVQRIQERAVRMSAVIDDLLRLSELSLSQPTPQRVPFSEVVDAVRHELHELLERSGAVLQVAPTPLPTIAGDRRRLTLLLLHLVSNAIKFNPSRRPLVTLHWEERDDVFHFRVTDNGPGIDPRYHSKIFEMFQRVNPSKERPLPEGTGVGLCMCRRIVEQHGGTIFVQSQVGEGATFHFTLPKGLLPLRGPVARPPEG